MANQPRTIVRDMRPRAAEQSAADVEAAGIAKDRIEKIAVAERAAAVETDVETGPAINRWGRKVGHRRLRQRSRIGQVTSNSMAARDERERPSNQ